MTYHIFIGEKEIVLDKELHNEKMENGTVYMTYDSPESLKLATETLCENSLANKFIIAHNDTDELFEIFSSLFINIAAAGGLVKNTKEEYLFIFRNGKWDLPKGKMEEGEKIEQCAIREVEEECGIKNLSIIQKLLSTFHIYSLNGSQILKTTHWFEMKCDDASELVPQKNEGIEKAEWKSKSETKVLLENSYASLRNLAQKIY